MPTGPRDSIGVCAALGVSQDPFVGPFSAWQTGGAGAGTIAASSTASFPWPPTTTSNVNVAPTLLPSYTATASIASLRFITPTPTPAGTNSADAALTITASMGNGWFDAADQTRPWRDARTPMRGALSVRLYPQCARARHETAACAGGFRILSLGGLGTQTNTRMDGLCLCTTPRAHTRLYPSRFHYGRYFPPL
jgi:hypothetical protein